MVEPTERVLWLLGAVAVIGIVSAAISVMNLAAPIALGALVLLVVIDAVAAGSPTSVRVTRQLPERAVVGEATPCHYIVTSERATTLEIVDTLPVATPPWLTLRTEVGAGETRTVPFAPVSARRGENRFGRLALRTVGPLGLARRRARRELDDVLRVGVDIVAVQKRAHALLFGTGASGRARRLGRGREFDSLREYQRGDDVRQMAWKASARRGQLVVKKTRPERRQDVWVLVDGGRQLLGQTTREGRDETRFDVALEAGLSVTAAALALGDAAGALCFADTLRAAVRPRAGRGQLREVASALMPLEARPEESVYAVAAERVARWQTRRALVIIITDVNDVHHARGLVAAVQRLRGRHLPVVCAIGDAELDKLAHDEDEAVRTAAHYVLKHRRRALAALAAAGATVVDTTPADAAAKLIAAYAEVKATGRL